MRSLLKGVDHEKKGSIKQEVFYKLLELHKIELSNGSKQYLNKNFGKNDEIKYKEAMNQVTVDLDAAGDGGSEIKWTVQANVKR